ncbi:unnamed protein product [Brassica oleracea var. botrytis]
MLILKAVEQNLNKQNFIKTQQRKEITEDQKKQRIQKGRRTEEEE